MTYPPVTSADVLGTLMVGADVVTFTAFAGGVLEAVCDYCPRPASHAVTIDGRAAVYVCRSHAKIAADALADKVVAAS